MPSWDISPQYLAGFIDADGSIFMQEHKTWKTHTIVYPVVAAGCTDKMLIEAIHSSYGGVIARDIKPKRGRLFYYYNTWSGQKAQHLLVLVAPFLIIKQNQAALALTWPLNPRSGYPLPDDIKEFRRSMLTQMRSLNHREADFHDNA